MHQALWRPCTLYPAFQTEVKQSSWMLGQLRFLPARATSTTATAEVIFPLLLVGTWGWCLGCSALITLLIIGLMVPGTISSLAWISLYLSNGILKGKWIFDPPLTALGHYGLKVKEIFLTKLARPSLIIPNTTREKQQIEMKMVPTGIRLARRDRIIRKVKVRRKISESNNRWVTVRHWFYLSIFPMQFHSFLPMGINLPNTGCIYICTLLWNRKISCGVVCHWLHVWWSEATVN